MQVILFRIAEINIKYATKKTPGRFGIGRNGIKGGFCIKQSALDLLRYFAYQLIWYNVRNCVQYNPFPSSASPIMTAQLQAFVRLY